MDIKKVLVIGGAGYIGAHVVDSLIKHGYSVAVFDNLSTGRKKHIPSSVPITKSSILNKKALDQMFESYKPDAVIHLAALKAAGESMSNAADYSDTNITGTINILRAMVEHKVSNLVFSSSAAIYGYPQYLPIDEEHLQNPISYYGATKQIMEEIIRWYTKVYGIKHISLRYFNAAGHMPNAKVSIVEPNPQNLIPVVLEVAMKKREKLLIFGNDYNTPDGTCLRDYIHVCDLAEAHALSLRFMNVHEESLELNLGTGKSFSVQEIYNVVCEISGLEIPMEYVERRPGDMDALYAKSVLAYKKLKWTPQYTDIRTIIQHAWDATIKAK